MRVNGFRCDGCGKEHLLAAYQMPSTYAEFVPADWFIVYPGGQSTIREPWLFCSKACLRDHPLQVTKDETPRKLKG